MTTNLLIFSGGIGWSEVLIILVVVLVFFGGRRIPQLAKDLGSGIREFRKSLMGTTSELEEPEDKDEAPQNTASRKKTGGRKRA